MRTALTALVLAAGLGLSSLALAHGPGGPKGPPPPVGPLMHALQEITLDNAQQAALDDALETIEATRPERPPRGERPERVRGERDDNRPSRDEMKARAERIEAELSTATPDSTYLHGLLDGGPRGEAPQQAHDHLDLLLGVHATLGAEQRAELVDALAEGRQRHAERRRECDGERRSRGE